MALSIKVRKKKQYSIMVLSGRVIDVDAKKFSAKLESLCKKATKDLILDISNVEFIDSYGLGIIVFNHTYLSNCGLKLILLNTNPDPLSYISRLFEMTHLDKVFKTVSSLDEL